MAAENQDSKTFDPTPQRIQQFRKEGKVAVSKDVIGVAVLAIGMLSFVMVGPALFGGFRSGTQSAFQDVASVGPVPPNFLDAFFAQMLIIGPPAAFIALVITVAILAAGFWQTKFVFSPESLKLKFDRLNAFQKLPELFSPKKAGMQVLLAVVKISIACSVLWAFLDDATEGVAGLSLGSQRHVHTFLEDLLVGMLLATTAALSVTAVADYIWQKYQLMQEMKMTREEVKRDQDEQEGKPEFKGKRRQMHRDLSMNRIAQAIPEADVVVTNPIHLAIIIRYKPGQDSVPLVTGKGAESVAAYIRSLAREHGIPIVENKPLARVLWRKVKVGNGIPQSLFEAVAAVLAKVFKARAQRASL